MKTAVIFTGGTIASSLKNGFVSTDNDAKLEILDGICGVDVIEPYMILSENLNGEHLNCLIKCIEDCLKNYSGIIVCHGTDTLQYSASAAAYAFGSDTVPIVFVSSNYILSDTRANGRSNFKYALDFINNSYGRGTFISYKNSGETPKIHRASRVLAYHQYSDSIISLGGEYGEYKDGVFIKNPEYIEFDDETTPFGTVDFTRKNIKKINAYPNMKIDASVPVLIETYHSGTLPEYAINDALIYITGIERGLHYESVRVYDRENIHILRRAAAPAMYMKLWMCYCSDRLFDMNKCLAGDFTE